MASVVLEVSPAVYSVLKKYGKLRIGMCVYPIEDHIRVSQCQICMRTGHVAKFCRTKNEVCGICSGPHLTLSCPHFQLKQDFTAYKKFDQKKCSNCEGHATHRSQCYNHGSSDTQLCPYYKEQNLRYQQQIDYGP